MEEKKPLTKEGREKLKKEQEKKLRERRAQEEYKRRYFAYYDDIKISHREDW